jgi:DNA-binding NtrC family response regulator
MTVDTYPELISEVNVLVADDEQDLCMGMERLISSLGAQVKAVHSAEHALAYIEQNPVDIVISDIMMGGMSGIELQQEIYQRWPEIQVVLITGFGTIEMAVECLQKGAAHFLTKPFDNEEISKTLLRLGNEVINRKADKDLEVRNDGIIAADPKMLKVLELIDQVAETNLPVSIIGESGTGKELAARAIHQRSVWSKGRMVPVNCAALPDTLLESELFGYRKGAFTGAEKNHDGMFMRARNGTIFLDEVPSMSVNFQGKLLRILQEKRIRQLGADAEEALSFRLVSASNRDLKSLVESGSLREDLYYRLSAFVIEIPPLRERPLDIIPLAKHFLAESAKSCLNADDQAPVLSSETLALLQDYTWKGNVRELQHSMQRAAVLCRGGEIQPSQLMLDHQQANGSRSTSEDSYELAKQEVLDSFQRQFLCRILERTRGNISQAAEECGLTRVAIQKMMRKLKIDRTNFH